MKIKFLSVVLLSIILFGCGEKKTKNKTLKLKRKFDKLDVNDDDSVIYSGIKSIKLANNGNYMLLDSKDFKVYETNQLLQVEKVHDLNKYKYLFQRKIQDFDYYKNKFYFIDDTFVIKEICLQNENAKNININKGFISTSKGLKTQEDINFNYKKYLLWNSIKVLNDSSLIASYKINMRFLRKFNADSLVIGGLYNMNGRKIQDFTVARKDWSYKIDVSDKSFLTIFDNLLLTLSKKSFDS